MHSTCLCGPAGWKLLVPHDGGMSAVTGDIGVLFAAVARSAREGGNLHTQYPKDLRLALEIAAHEDVERRAIEGELAVLAHEWREAEEVAAIVDGL